MQSHFGAKSLKAFYISEYRHFIFARLLFVFALRMISTCVMFQIFDITKSTYAVGLAGLAEFIPVVTVAIYSGSYADRHNKKNILSICYFLFLLCGVALFFIQFLPENKIVNSLYIIMACTGIVRSFAAPASNGMIAAMVPNHLLPQATGFNSQAWLISSALGHATGGFIIYSYGLKYSYILVSILFLSAFLFTLTIKPKPPVKQALTVSIFTSMKEGFEYVWLNKNLLGVMSLDLFAVLLGGAVAFIPEVSKNILSTSSIGLGFLNSAIDIGALVSIFLLTIFPMKKNQGLKMLIAVALFGLCIIIFGISRNYFLSFAALFFAGLADGISVMVRGVVMQMQTPDELRGRVSSINSIFINSSNELGQFESGFTSKLMGTQRAIIFGGAATIMVVILMNKIFPNLKKLRY